MLQWDTESCGLRGSYKSHTESKSFVQYKRISCSGSQYFCFVSKLDLMKLKPLLPLIFRFSCVVADALGARYAITCVKSLIFADSDERCLEKEIYFGALLAGTKLQLIPTRNHNLFFL